MRGRRIGYLRGCLPALLLVLLAFGPRAGAAQTQPTAPLGQKTVLILHAFERTTPTNEKTDQGLRDSLDAGGIGTKNQLFEYLDLLPDPGPEYKKRLAELLRLHYSQRKIDMIITLYNEALQFLLNEGRDLFPDVPVLALYLSPGIELPKTHRRIIEHQVTYDMAGTLEMALKLVPEAKRVYLISGVYASDRRLQNQARRDLTKWEGSLEFQYVSNMSMEQILTEASRVPPRSIIMYLSVLVDSAGKTYTAKHALEQISRVSQAPVFGLYDILLGYGIAGGSLVSFQLIGTRAGEMALDILRGANTPDSMPTVLDVPTVPMFDWRQLTRWNLSVSAVPPGSIIINREYTLWERYRTGVIAAFFVLVLQALLIVSLVVNRAQRQRAEQQIAYQLRIETLLAKLSARLVHLPANQIEGEIQAAQRRICEALDLDRATLLQVPPDEPDTMRLTHVHTPPETPPVPALLDVGDVVPWLVQKVLRGETLTISKLAALPPEAARDREFLQRYGTKSFVAIPLVAEGAVLGALSFAATRAERAWPEDVVKGFRMVGEVMANALARRRADQALRESQARLTLAVASADARLWEVEAETERVWMMEQGRVFFGVTPNETLTVDRLASFIHPDDREPWRQSIRQAMETGQPMRAEFRVIGADGSVRWIASQGRLHVDAAGKPGRLLGVSIDVTERRQTEERLRASEVLSSGILSSLPGGMVIVDRSGAVLQTSDSWQEFAAGNGALDPTVLAIGAGQPHARERSIEKAGPAVKEVQEGINAVLAGTHTEFRLDYAYPTRTEERWASISVLPLKRPEGGAVIYHQDITAQQRSRLQAERLHRDLTHVGRVTTMGEMAAALAHELNQPLTAILSNAHAGERYLAQTTPPLGEVREILQDVAGDARRAGEVIQRLRGLLRKDNPKFLPLDINQLVREMAVLTRTEAILRDLVIDLDLARNLPAVHGDRVQIQQVLLNLVLNGMEAAGPHGGGKRILIRTRQAEGAVRVAVRDEGSGIPADKLSQVFETFYTTKPTGMGMGLAISRSIVESHGGRLWAENNPDRGATFSFTLPVRPPEASLSGAK